MTKINQTIPVVLRPAFIILVILGLQGCAISSITSGFGGGLFGKKKEARHSGDDTSVSQRKLLAAAQSDIGGGADSLGLGTNCPKFEPSPDGRLFTKYEPGREGNSLGIVYRGEITKTARECRIDPGQIGIKYGFAGRVLLGPRGQDGTVQLPIMVHVTDKNYNKISTQRMSVRVNVAKNDPIGFFSVVKVVKFPIQTGARPLDYKLLIAFERPGVNR